MALDLNAQGEKYIAGLGDGSTLGQAMVQTVALASGVAIDGGITIGAGAPDTTLFGGVVPLHGYMLQNNTGDPAWWNDTGAAASFAAPSFQLAPGASWITPPHYIPAGAVHVIGGTPGQTISARGW